MRHRLLALVLLVAVGCSQSAEERSAAEQRSVASGLKQLEERSALLENAGVQPDDPVVVGFSFYGGTKGRAVSLHTAMKTKSLYSTEVRQFKEPRAGWFVIGETTAMPLRDARQRSLLVAAVALAVDHGCELEWWQLDRPNDDGLSNSGLQPAVAGATAADADR